MAAHWLTGDGTTVTFHVNGVVRGHVRGDVDHRYCKSLPLGGLRCYRWIFLFTLVLPIPVARDLEWPRLKEPQSYLNLTFRQSAASVAGPSGFDDSHAMNGAFIGQVIALTNVLILLILVK